MGDMDSTGGGAGVEIELRVRFAETDLMGVVHHGVYPVWLEAGRIAWLDAAGIPYSEIVGGGNHFAVTGLTIQYRAPARFGDVIRIRTVLESMRSRQVSFAYEALRAGDDTLLATATTDLVCVDMSGSVAKIPEDVAARMDAGAHILAGRGQVETQAE